MFSPDLETRRLLVRERQESLRQEAPGVAVGAASRRNDNPEATRAPQKAGARVMR